MPLFFMHVRSTRYLIWVGRPCIFYVVMEWYCVRFDTSVAAAGKTVVNAKAPANLTKLFFIRIPPLFQSLIQLSTFKLYYTAFLNNN